MVCTTSALCRASSSEIELHVDFLMLRLFDFDAVTFDVYGTLIDWEPSIVAFLREWAGKAVVKAEGEELIMAFDRARADIQKERPAHLYPEVLRRCFDRISAEYNVPVDATQREAFSRTPHDWPAYSDASEGLKVVQARAKIGALSNIDNVSLSSSCAKIDIRFDIVVTAERVGAYKLAQEHFDTAIADLDALGILPSDAVIDRIRRRTQSRSVTARRRFPFPTLTKRASRSAIRPTSAGRSPKR